MSNRDNLKSLRPNVGFLLKEAAGYSRQWDLDLPVTVLDEDTRIEWLRGQLELTRTSQGIWVNGALTVTTLVDCARCLKNFAFSLEISLEELFYYPPSNAPGPSDYVIAEDGILDFVEPVREQIVLGAPMRPLCKPDCLGLCSHCGKNRNRQKCRCEEEFIDPRLAALQELLSDDE